MTVAVSAGLFESVPVTAVGLFLVGFGTGTWDVVDERRGRRGRAAAGALGDAAVPRRRSAWAPSPVRRSARWSRTSAWASAGTSARSPCSSRARRAVRAGLPARRAAHGDAPPATPEGLDRAAHAADRGDGAGDGADRGGRQRLARRRDGRRVRRARLARGRRVRAVRDRDDRRPGHRHGAARHASAGCRCSGAAWPSPPSGWCWWSRPGAVRGDVGHRALGRRARPWGSRSA